MIDIIFKDILKWEEANITREERINTDDSNEVLYIDYIYESNDNKFLVEAKKTGYYFNTPAKGRKLKRDGILLKDKNTCDALNQAYKYCKSKKIDVGCICNGHQFIVFIINNYGLPHDTYVFNSIDSIKDNIIDFVNIFSPYSNALMILKEIFSINNSNIRDVPQFSRTLNQEIYNSDERINRNPIDQYVRPIISEFFSDLISDETLKYLNECYCENERTTQYEKQLTALLADDIPKLGIPVQDSSNFDEDFIRKEKKHIFQLGKSSDVMMIVGGVGAGKTTFLHRYFKFVLPEYIRKNVICLFMDFTEVADENINIKDYILTEALKQIRENYSFLKIDDWSTLSEIYKPDIIRLKNGSLKPIYQTDKKEYNSYISKMLYEKQTNEISFSLDVLKYIAMKQDLKKVICLIIDNADQKSEAFQIQCLKTAYEFSKEIKSLVLLSFREETYWKLRNSNPFDAYPGYAYHISAPSVSKIISKRIQTAIKYNKNVIMDLIAPNNFRCKLNVNEFLSLLSNSLFSQNESNNILFFEALSVNNLRYATEMLGTFLTSGHTNTIEYIQTYLNQGKYEIPFHAFVRSIALGDYRYYHSNKSLIGNIIQIEEDGFYSHFTKLRILSYLKERSSFDSVIGKGFISITSMYKDFSGICSNEDSFRNAFSSLLIKRLVQADNGFNIYPEDADYIRITSAGYYYLEILLKEFAYLERLCEDTQILSKNYFDKLHQQTHLIIEAYAKNPDKKFYIMKLRLERIKIFLEYLKEQEDSEIDYLDNENIKFVYMNEIISAFNKQSKEILRSISLNKY